MSLMLRSRHCYIKYGFKQINTQGVFQPKQPLFYFRYSNLIWNFFFSYSLTLTSIKWSPLSAIFHYFCSIALWMHCSSNTLPKHFVGIKSRNFFMRWPRNLSYRKRIVRAASKTALHYAATSNRQALFNNGYRIPSFLSHRFA